VVQIVEFVGEPPRVKLRYRLVEDATGAPPVRK
jgi:hypothetical protein